MRGRFTPPGVRVTPESQPRLMALVEEEAGAARGRGPDEIYVTFGVDAAVTGYALILGLPLLHIVSERGLRALLAHELAGRGRRFARRHGAEADRHAARRAGRDVHVATLQRLHALGPVFDSYWANEVAPILAVGRRPPVGAGFAAFARAPAVERAAAVHLERALADGLAERIAAVGDLPAGDRDDSPPAAELLRDPAALERAQAIHVFGDEAATLLPIGWESVGAEVFLERARRLVATHGDLLADATAGELIGVVDRLGPVAGELQRREPGLAIAHARDFACALIADGLLVALHDSGWTVEAPPAEAVLCRRGHDRVAPHLVVDQLREGRLTGEGWRERAEALGIEAIPLRAGCASPSK